MHIPFRPTNNHSAGFTIVELMIATAVFSVVLLLCATAIVQVGRQFYKGVTINRVQDTARQVSDDIAQAIQFGAGTDNLNAVSRIPAIPNSNVTQAYCIDGVRYTYNLKQNVGSLKHVLWKDRIGNNVCVVADLTANDPSTVGGMIGTGKELLGTKMRVSKFDIAPASTQLWSINLTVAYGEDDVFVGGAAAGNFNQCVGGNIGGQFCAVSTINTSVVKRL